MSATKSPDLLEHEPVAATVAAWRHKVPSQDSPKVFLSYSHDSAQHKDWVRQLAERLRHDGVDVTLDQWDLRPGDDVTSFMELALSSCNYVLIVCTEQYVEKANTLKGGVGYERMIITSEIAVDLKSHKFIPLIRNTGQEAVPRFLGPKLHLDFRTGDFDLDPYDELLRTLLGQPKHKKPPVGSSPYLSGETAPTITGKNSQAAHFSVTVRGFLEASEESDTDGHDPWPYHWHRSLHQYCGYNLYLILVRFAAGSIIMRESILEDLRAAGVSNYMIFHLYSQWDLLIRAWADEETVAKLRSRLTKNADIHKDRKPEFLLVNAHTHFPDADTSPDAQRDVERILGHAGLASVQEIQDRGKQSEGFRRLKEAGLILSEKVGFDPERIQFYITIRSLYPLDLANLTRLEALVAKSTSVRNRSVYATIGSSIGAVIKAQAGDYYDIDEFLHAVTRELGSRDITTETMLVANRAVSMGKGIDLDRADRHVIERELRVLIPEVATESPLSLGERLMLESKYVEVRGRLPDDRDGILVNLIRARANGSAEEVAKTLSFLPALEEKLRKRLIPVLVRVYGKEWQQAIDALKSSEGIQTKKVEDFVLGDLFKIYKRIVLDQRIIEIAPLGEKEFCVLMDATPVIRNEFAHKAPNLKHWESLFSFCSEFIPIYWRLLDAIEI